MVGGLLPDVEMDECVWDWFFDITAGANNLFHDSVAFRHGFMIFSGLLIDVLMVSQFFYFIFKKWNTWRYFLALAGFYGFWMIVQNLFLMKKPPGYLWEYPGFPSLVVPYDPTNDFFYSGHIGGSLITVLEWKEQGYWSMVIFGIVSIVVTFWLLVIAHVHFLCDIVAGFFIGHYMFIFAKMYAPYFDRVICWIDRRKYRLYDKVMIGIH